MQRSRLYQRLLDGSLREHRELADELFGARGALLVAQWLEEELAKVDDPAYVRLFTDHVCLPGVAPEDYAHRVVETSHGALLGGIRFYGRDVARPFVEVVAHDVDDLDFLRDCVHREWSTFATRFARLRTRPGSVRGPRVLLDQGVHLARYRDMPASDGRIRLAPFDDVDDVIAVVRHRYERLAVDSPALGRNVPAADPDDIRQWHTSGRMQAIMLQDRITGLLAVAPGRIGWIEGDEVNEEVVDVEHAGHGYAASAQREWASRQNGDRLLVGTVDGRNHASRATARRAGRPSVLDDVFLLLP
ncbi:hypothetical protein H7J06_30185 [Mycobacterium hodleri]|uniref:hypothetical protein n=1 Tax=Mycolicibacterium hodleri TaxID=49897 RepID=UPI0021F31989|nr:hypothetical protein [Mycolicibacterium hodleri]MCV7137239.1 hypothetical protein [Mycolicibacterium hodleri]